MSDIRYVIGPDGTTVDVEEVRAAVAQLADAIRPAVEAMIEGLNAVDAAVRQIVAESIEPLKEQP